MYQSEAAVMSHMMSSMWLITVVGLVSTNLTSSTAGLPEISSFSSVLAKPKSSFRSPVMMSSHQSNFIQSTEGLLVSQTRSPSALVATMSNMPVLPTPSLFTLFHDANLSIPSFTHIRSSSFEPMSQQLASTSPIEMKKTFMLSNQRITTQLSLSSVLFPPIETVQQDEQISYSAVIPMSSSFTQLERMTMLTSRSTLDGSPLSSKTSDVESYVGSTKTVLGSSKSISNSPNSQLELKTTVVSTSILPLLSEQLLFPSVHELASTRVPTPITYTSGHVLPSFEMFTETFGFLSASVSSVSYEDSNFNTKTPSLIHGDDIPMATEDNSPASTDFWDNISALPEQRSSYSAFAEFVGTRDEVVIMKTSASINQVLRNSLSSDKRYEFDSSHLELDLKRTDTVGMATSSTFPIKVSSVFLETVEPSDDAVAIVSTYQISLATGLATEKMNDGLLYMYQTSDAGIASTLNRSSMSNYNLKDWNTALQEMQPPSFLFSHSPSDGITASATKADHPHINSFYSSSNLDSDISAKNTVFALTATLQPSPSSSPVQHVASSSFLDEIQWSCDVSSSLTTILQLSASPSLQASQILDLSFMFRGLLSSTLTSSAKSHPQTSLLSFQSSQLGTVSTFSSLAKFLSPASLPLLVSANPTLMISSVVNDQVSSQTVLLSSETAQPNPSLDSYLSDISEFFSLIGGSSTTDLNLSTKLPQLTITALRSLTASQLPALSRRANLPSSDFSSSTETPQSTYSLQAMLYVTGFSAEELSTSTEIPPLTFSPSLHTGPLPFVSSISSGLSAKGLSSSANTLPSLTASLSLLASPLPSISNMRYGMSTEDVSSSATKTPPLTASPSLHASPLPPVSSMSNGLLAENVSSSTKTPPVTASPSLHASPLPSVSSMSNGLSAENISSSTKTPPITASPSLHVSPLSSVLSMSRELSAKDFSSSTKTPPITASPSLHASPLSSVLSMSRELSAKDFSSSTKTPPITASHVSYVSSLPAFPSFVAGCSSKPSQPMSQTEQIQPSSRKLLALTTATVAMTTSSLTYPTLDRSFSTNPFWLKVDVSIQEDIDVKQRDFIVAMETSLATAYSEGKALKDARATVVQDLLEQLNPDNDPLLNVRRKRAVTVDGNTAQVIDVSRDVSYPESAVLVFYIAEGDTSIPAGESKAIFSELTLQELTFYLQVVVQSFPTEFIEAVVITTSPPPDLTPLWIVLGVFGGLALMFCGCCCCFFVCRICCRPRPKSARDGPMDMDTLKMLQHKQKYPYRPYKSPNQTPRGFDIAKETDGTVDAVIAKETSSAGSKVRLQSSGTGSILKKQLTAVNAARLDADAYSSSSSSDLSLHGNDLAVPPLELNSLKEGAAKKTLAVNGEDAFHKAASSLDLNSSERSHRSSGRNQPRLLPLRSQIGHNGDEWNLKSGHRSGRSSRRDSPHSLSTSREAEELRRIYREAQREISRVLEPDIIPDQSDRTYVAPERRSKSQGKSSKRRNKMQESDFGGRTSDPILPDTHYARKASKRQTSGQKRPEALQEARRRVHDLIDEAFSLVGLPKNAVSPALLFATSNTPIATKQEEQTSKTKDNQSLFQRKISDSMNSSAADVKEKELDPSLGEVGNKMLRGRDFEEKTTGVVIVPVTHQPDRAAGIVWNPYSTEDDFIQLQKSQQLMSVPGGVEDTHHPHQPTSHLSMPHPVSVPETSPETWGKGITSSGQSQRKLSDSKERKPSTGLRRLSTDSNISKQQSTDPDEPYLDTCVKSNLNNELRGTFTLSPHSDDPAVTEKGPFTLALHRSSNEERNSPEPDYGKGNLLSTLSKERGVGKPIADGYDEFDVTRDVVSRDKSGQLVAAIRDELVRLAKKSGQHGSSS